MIAFVPPRSTKYSFKQGDSHVGVWAIQRAFNSLYDTLLIEDGAFGRATLKEVYEWQEKVGLTADGVFGSASQLRLSQSCRSYADRDGALPKGLMEGLIQGESGGYIAAVNWAVSGGVDCGYTQRRIYEPYTESEVKRAFDPLYQISLFADTFRAKFEEFRTYAYVRSRSDRDQFAWRLAALNHNWPYGASVLAKGQQLSTRTASWVHPGTKFEDGAAVVTFRDWARFYAMGSRTHRHRGLVVKQAFGIPIDG